MSISEEKCLNCGAVLYSDGNKLICSYCGATYEKNSDTSTKNVVNNYGNASIIINNNADSMSPQDYISNISMNLNLGNFTIFPFRINNVSSVSVYRLESSYIRI